MFLVSAKPVKLDSQKSATLRKAVRTLREVLGDTQQSFASRLGLAIATVVRYELTRAPRGAACVKFLELATANGMYDLAQVFREGFLDGLGINEWRLINMGVGLEVGLRLDLQAARRDVQALEAEVGRLRELLKLALFYLPRDHPRPAALFPESDRLPQSTNEWGDLVNKIEAELLRSENSETGG